MELDQLKQVWQEQQAPSTKGLDEIIGKRSNSPIAKMKRNLILELVAIILSFGTIIFFYFAEFNGRYLMISLFYGFLAILFFIYFYFKYKLLHEMDCMACQVKSNLSKQVSTLEKFTKLYLWAGTALVPLVLIFFYFYIVKDVSYSRSMDINPYFLKTILVFTLFTTAVTVPMYFLNKWYIRKLYGRQIERLKQMLEQMEQD